MDPVPAQNDCGALLFDERAAAWLRFAAPLRVLVAPKPADVAAVLAAVEQATAGGFWAVGFLSYEAAPAFDPAFAVRTGADFPCAWFGVYREPVRGELPPLDAAGRTLDWQPSVGEDEYLAAIARIKSLIQAGDTYQVNYSFRLRAAFDGDAAALFRRLVAPHAPGLACYLDAGRWAVCSASPELFLAREGGLLASRPMKGTVPRGLWPEDDADRGERLRASEKNRAENVMIVDMVRNDLGRIAEPGSVAAASLFDLERHATVWQMTSTVRAATRRGLTDVLAALFPPASITGAPKVRTMQIIAALETSPRRIYTGALGFAAPGGRAQFNVAIRTVLVDRQARRAEYGVGGGIVWDSEARDEHGECLAKARALLQPWPEFALLETLLWTPEAGYLLLEDHLARMGRSADYFSFAFDEAAVRAALDAEAAGFGPAAPAMRARLVVARDGRPSVASGPLRGHPPRRVRLAPRPVDSGDPFLYHKTTWRRVYDEARRSCAGADDALLWNERGEITESTLANFAADLDGERVTPPVDCGLLAGTRRARMLRAGELVERRLRVEDLPRCQALFLLNSVRGLWPVCLAFDAAV